MINQATAPTPSHPNHKRQQQKSETRRADADSSMHHHHVTPAPPPTKHTQFARPSAASDASPSPALIRPNLPVSPDPTRVMASLLTPPQHHRREEGGATPSDVSSASASEGYAASSLRSSWSPSLLSTCLTVAAKQWPPSASRRRPRSRVLRLAFSRVFARCLSRAHACRIAIIGSRHFTTTANHTYSSWRPSVRPETVVSLPRLAASPSPAQLRLFASRASVALRCVVFALRHSDARAQSLQAEVNRSAGKLLQMSLAHEQLQKHTQQQQQEGDKSPAAAVTTRDKGYHPRHRDVRRAAPSAGSPSAVRMSYAMRCSAPALSTRRTRVRTLDELAQTVSVLESERVALGAGCGVPRSWRCRSGQGKRHMPSNGREPRRVRTRAPEMLKEEQDAHAASRKLLEEAEA